MTEKSIETFIGFVFATTEKKAQARKEVEVEMNRLEFSEESKKNFMDRLESEWQNEQKYKVDFKKGRTKETIGTVFVYGLLGVSFLLYYFTDQKVFLFIGGGSLVGIGIAKSGYQEKNDVKRKREIFKESLRGEFG